MEIFIILLCVFLSLGCFLMLAMWFDIIKPDVKKRKYWSEIFENDKIPFPIYYNYFNSDMKNDFHIFSYGYLELQKKFLKCDTLKKLKEIYTYEKIQKIYNDLDFVDLHISDVEKILDITPKVINSKYYFNNRCNEYKYIKSIECIIDENNIIVECNIHNRHFIN